jgi:hypothetical protein
MGSLPRPHQEVTCTRLILLNVEDRVGPSHLKHVGHEFVTATKVLSHSLSENLFRLTKLSSVLASLRSNSPLEVVATQIRIGEFKARPAVDELWGSGASLPNKN